MTNPGELQATALEPGMGRSEDPNGRCVFFMLMALDSRTAASIRWWPSGASSIRPASAARPILRVPVGAELLPPQRRGEVIAAGRRALAAGFSRQRIAAEFGVSRRTVDRWAR